MTAAGSATGLAHFLHRSCIPIRNLWPCPPPGRWTADTSTTPNPRKRRRLRHHRARAFCLQRLIITLNWLALGQCRSPPEHARVGYPASDGQLALMERLGDLVDYYLGCGDVTLDSLGRAGEKLKKLNALAFSLPSISREFEFSDLTSFLDLIHTSFDSYTRPRKGTPNSKKEPKEHGSAQTAQGGTRPQVLSSNACSAMPVEAARIKWKLAPTFDPRPYLSDPIVRQAFDDPEVLRRPSSDWPKVAKAKVHASRAEVLALAEKWDSLGACQLTPCSTVNDIETVGLFAVPKDDAFDRLILNPTVVNSRSFSYSNFTRTLAPGYLMTLIPLAADEHLLISSDDLCEFYYTFVVSSKRAKRNAIGIKYKASEVAHLQCFNPAVHVGPQYICLGTLAMGDALAVEIAQQSHLNLLRQRAGCMLREECLQYRCPIPRGPFYELLTIDDHIGLQKVKLSGSLSIRGIVTCKFLRRPTRHMLRLV